MIQLVKFVLGLALIGGVVLLGREVYERMIANFNPLGTR